MNSTKLFLILGVVAAFTIAATLAYQDTNKDCNNANSANKTYTKTNGDICNCDGPGMFGINRDTAQCKSSTTKATTAAKTTATTTTTTESPTYTDNNRDCTQNNSTGKPYTRTTGDICKCRGTQEQSIFGPYNSDKADCERATTTTAAKISTTAAPSS